MRKLYGDPLFLFGGVCNLDRYGVAEFSKRAMIHKKSFKYHTIASNIVSKHNFLISLRKAVFGVSDQAVQLHKMPKGLKSRIWEVEGL